MDKVEQAFILYQRGLEGNAEAVEQLIEMQDKMSEKAKKELKEIIRFQSMATKTLN